jgi:hypothetical protein
MSRKRFRTRQKPRLSRTVNRSLVFTRIHILSLFPALRLFYLNTVDKYLIVTYFLLIFFDNKS